MTCYSESDYVLIELSFIMYFQLKLHFQFSVIHGWCIISFSGFVVFTSSADTFLCVFSFKIPK